MIQKNGSRQRLPASFAVPSAEEIALRRKQIQRSWSQKEKDHRAQGRRCDTGDLRYDAHLRFAQFLIAFSESRS